jgi:hypothetical protein
MSQNHNIINKHDEILNQWKIAIDSGNINQAVNLDFNHYNELVKPTENQALWDKWQKDTFKYRNEIQSKFQKIVITKKSLEKRRFLIVHHNYSGLANEAQLVRNLEFIKNNIGQIEFQVAYLFGGNFKQQEAAIKLYKIKIDSIYFLQSKNYPDAGNKLNWLVNNKSFASIIYPSIFPMAFWMSLYVNHSNQKFLQMKYFPKQVGRISDWGCGRKNSQSIYIHNNDEFTQLSVLNPANNKFHESNSNRKIFNINQHKIRFGSISRPEKISNVEYNNFVLKLLNDNNNIMYLYTGREENCDRIPSQVRHHAHSYSLGWVEPEKVINEFDIYLEPFPWGGGDMTFLALQTGTPYLTLDTPQNRLVGVYEFLYYLTINQSEILQFSFCDSLETLNYRFNMLIKDKFFGKELGKAWAKVINNYRPIDSNSWIKFLLN